MAALVFVVLVVPPVASVAGLTAGQQGSAPLITPDFFKVAPEGIDANYTNGRHNSWPWSMVWWPQHTGPGGANIPAALYVGTVRDYRCFSFAALAQAVIQSGITLPANIFPYPPPQPSQDLCTTSPSDLSMQAEIWRWIPPSSGQVDTSVANGGGTWERVYQSPDTLPNPDYPGKFVPPDIGFRGMGIYTDTDGIQTLYVAGVSTQPMWKGKVPPPRILYSKTGAAGSFVAVPQDPGTFLGDLSKASNRSIESFNNQLFTINGSIEGNGVILGSSNPSQGDNAWAQVSAGDTKFFEIYPWNGYLYAGTFEATGYRVLKTRATGSYPFTDWVTVVPSGANASTFSKAVVSMHAYNGQLYVGTDNPAEIIRINPDDTWDLVVGTARELPDGTWKYPISGLDEGFANQFNDHIYRMADVGGTLYAGTYDSSVNWEGTSVWNSLQSILGFDLYRTSLNGWYWTPITTNGLAFATGAFGLYNGTPTTNPPPLTKDLYNFAVRTFSSTPFGLFLGASNDSYGLNMYLGNGSTPVTLPSPTRLAMEMRGQQPVLSWDPVPGATAYQILRSKLVAISLPPIVVFPPATATSTSGTASGAAAPVPTYPTQFVQPLSGTAATPTPTISSQLLNTFTDTWAPSPYEAVATTANTLYVDAAIASDAPHGYLYSVVALLQGGSTVTAVSSASNIVQAPSISPPVTITSAQTMVNRWTSGQRNRFVSAAAQTATLNVLSQAATAIRANQLSAAADSIKQIRQSDLAGTVVLAPESTDLEVLTSQFLRRLKLAAAGVIDPNTLL